MWYFIAAGLVVIAVLAAVFGPRYFHLSGARVIRCPETKDYAAVTLDAAWAIVTGWVGRPALRLSDCTRWPERRGCGQECLTQIEAAPDGCLIQNILADCYEGKKCTYCHEVFGKINWMEHRPALLNPDGRTIEWEEIRPEDVPHAIESYQPVCWNCHIGETFRRMYPELVVEREWKAKASGS